MIIKRFVNQIHSGRLATRSAHPVNDEALFNPPITEIGLSVIMKSTPKHSERGARSRQIDGPFVTSQSGRRGHFLIVARQTQKVREKSSQNDEFVCPRPRY
jgi:hypothetical protein